MLFFCFLHALLVYIVLYISLSIYLINSCLGEKNWDWGQNLITGFSQIIWCHQKENAFVLRTSTLLKEIFLSYSACSLGDWIFVKLLCDNELQFIFSWTIQSLGCCLACWITLHYIALHMFYKEMDQRWSTNTNNLNCCSAMRTSS